MVATESSLLLQQQQLLSKGRLSRQELYQLNEIQKDLRNRYDYKYGEAPKYVRSDGKIVAKKGFSFNTPSADPEKFRETGEEIVEQNGYTYKRTDAGFETLSRSQKAQTQLDLTIGVNKRINLGENVKAKELAYGENEIKLTDSRVQAQSEAVEYQRREKVALAEQARKEEKQLEASASLSGFSPFSSAETGKTAFADKVGQTFRPETKEVGSNLKSTTFVPFATSQVNVRRQLTEPSVKEKFLAKQLERTRQSIELGKEVNEKVISTGGKALDFANKAVRENPVSLPQALFTEKPFTIGEGLDYVAKGSQKVFNADFGAKVVSNINEYPLFKGVAKITGEKSFTDSIKLTKPLKAFAQSTSNVAGEFISYGAKKPVTTYLSTFGLRRIIGKTAYGLLDKFDVTQSVVGEGVKGYVTGGKTGALAGALGGYAGERVSDKTIGVFDALKGVESPTFSTKIVSPYRKSLTFVASPAVSRKGNLVPNKYSIKLAITPTFKTLTTLPSKQSLKGGPVQDLQNNLLFYQSTYVQPESQFVGKGIFPKVVSLDLNRGPLGPKQRPVQKYTGGLFSKGLLRGKRASLSFSGSQSSSTSPLDFTGSNNFQGTFNVNTNFESTIPTITPQITPKSRSRKLPVFYQQARPQTLKISGVKSAYSSDFKVKAFTMGDVKSQLSTKGLSVPVSFANSIAQSQTQSQTQSLTRSLTQSLTQTQSQTRTPTLSQTLTQTVTKTPTITQTRTPTLTETLTNANKLSRSQFKATLGGRNAKSNFKSKYTPTAFAVGFNIKGRKLKGKLTGLEFRGVK